VNLAKIEPVGGKGLMTADIKHNSGSISDKETQVGEAESEADCIDLPAPDPELAAIVTAWPALPAAIKAGIVAMVGAAIDR
jgi:hypothetical protein